MADFKLCIGDPASGKSFQKEVRDADAKPFLGMNVGEKIKGEAIGLSGYEFLITCGSDNCGFPMRRGIQGIRKKLSLLGGVGLHRSPGRGIRKKKTVCGQKISEKITQINLVPTKAGNKTLAEIFAKPDAEKKAE